MMRADLTNLPRPAVFGVALLVCGCGPTLPGADDAGSTSASNGAAMPTTSGAMGTSMPGTTSTAGMASTGSETTSTGASSTGDDSTVMTVLDVGVVQCNPFTQDCPPGMKCAPYADDGGSSWNNDKCVPVAEDPAQVHEPCVAEGGGVSGFDNCDVGLFCWDVDAEENGYCIELCTGSAEQGFCEEPGYYCQVYSEAVIPLCMKGCDPLLQDCDPSDVCIRHPDGVGFLCVLDGSGDEGQQHDPCMYANACDSGLICAEVTTAVECDQNAQGCCQPFCDLTDPEADAKCGGVGQVCKTLFEDIRPLPEYEHVGYCTVPM